MVRQMRDVLSEVGNDALVGKAMLTVGLEIRRGWAQSGDDRWAMCPVQSAKGQFDMSRLARICVWIEESLGCLLRI